MSIEKNVQTVKNFLAALGLRDKHGLLALSAEDALSLRMTLHLAALEFILREQRCARTNR